MANEANISGSLSYTTFTAPIFPLQSISSSLAANVAGGNYARQGQLVATTPAVINLGTLATVGWFLFRNLDTTNFVEVATVVGFSANTIFAKLFPGEFCLLRLNPLVTAPAVRANTASCQCELMALPI